MVNVVMAAIMNLLDGFVQFFLEEKENVVSLLFLFVVIKNYVHIAILKVRSGKFLQFS